ncbi:phosphopantetheine-binding protein, partial [uncultured Aquimarina sp.]|uniref:phosphopantetheine-binding protein n=1 Tax=uncultured Aquimarina sp. TaxID=575652 RepID=UPI002617CD47
DVLGLDRVGVTDDFFRIGGNSILAITIISRINKTLSKELTIREFFSNTKIELISKLIQTRTHNEEILESSLGYFKQNDLLGKDNLYETLKPQGWRYLEYKLGTYNSMNAIIQKELIDVDKQSLSKAIDTLV